MMFFKRFFKNTSIMSFFTFIINIEPFASTRVKESFGLPSGFFRLFTTFSISFFSIPPIVTIVILLSILDGLAETVKLGRFVSFAEKV